MKTATKNKVVIFSVLLMSFMVFASMAMAADEYKIKLASIYNLKHPSIRLGMKPWAQELEKKSNGRLKIRIFNVNALVPFKEHLEAIRNSVVDMTFSAQGLNKGKFPLAEVIQLPFLFNTAVAGGKAGWDLVNQYDNIMNEYRDFKLLWIHASAPFQVHTSKKPIQKLEDIKGLKLIVWDAGSIRFVKALGANPLQVTPPDTYLALERGMADGVFCPLAPMYSYKVTEVTSHHTFLNLAVSPFWGGMSHKMWNKLPKDLQQLMVEETGYKMSQIAGGTLDKGDEKTVQKMKKEGGHFFYEISEAKMTRMRASLKPIYDGWLANAKKLGHDNAEEILKTVMELSKKYNK